jgi:hypothetical protein
MIILQISSAFLCYPKWWAGFKGKSSWLSIGSRFGNLREARLKAPAFAKNAIGWATRRKLNFERDHGFVCRDAQCNAVGRRARSAKIMCSSCILWDRKASSFRQCSTNQYSVDSKIEFCEAQQKLRRGIEFRNESQSSEPSCCHPEPLRH